MINLNTKNSIEALYNETTQAEPTSRLLPDNDTRIEYRGSGDYAGLPCVAYYYQRPSDADDNGSFCNWEIDHICLLSDDNFEIITID